MNPKVENSYPFDSAIKSVVAPYGGFEYPQGNAEDIFQSGVVGLLEAQARYQPDKSNSFWAYARKRITGSIYDEMRHIQRWQSDSSGGEADDQIEKRSWMGYTSRSVESYIQINQFAVFLMKQWAKLPKLWQEIIRLRFYQEMSLRETADRLGLSPSTARRVERRILETLKQRFLSRKR